MGLELTGRDRRGPASEEQAMFEPHHYGGLLVVTPVENPVIPVHATSQSDPENQLHAYPSKQEDGTWMAYFPVVPAGNWRVEMSYVYWEEDEEGEDVELSQVVTVFPGHVAQVTLREE
jgi:hypothetical protein